MLSATNLCRNGGWAYFKLGVFSQHYDMRIVMFDKYYAKCIIMYHHGGNLKIANMSIPLILFSL